MSESAVTLERMDGARRYNAWIGRQLRPYLGQRVLEVGAGIGTITREIEAGRVLVIALEVDKQGKPNWQFGQAAPASAALSRLTP